MDDIAVFEMYLCERAAHLSSQFDVLDRGKLTKEAQSGINLAHQRLAYHDLRKGRGSSRGDRLALTIRIGQPRSRYERDGQGRNCAGK